MRRRQVVGGIEWDVVLPVDREWVDEVMSYANLPSPEPEHSEWRAVHDKVRGYVASLTASSKSLRRKVYNELVDEMGSFVAKGAFNRDERGATSGARLRIEHGNWERLCLTALIAVYQAGLDDRVRRCPECMRDMNRQVRPKCLFFVAWDKRQVFCSAGHEDRHRKRRTRAERGQ